jgi:hypothetical protein
LFLSETQTNCKINNEKLFARTKLKPHLNLAAILAQIHHFESAKRLFFHELGLTKGLTKIKRKNATMLDFRGVLNLSAILKQSKIQLDSKLITVHTEFE